MKIYFDGVDKLKMSLEKVARKVEKQANDLVAGAALRTVAVAKNRLQPLPEDSRELTVDIGAVRQSITFTHDKSQMAAIVTAGNVTGEHMAAYLEFGTGRYAARYLSGKPSEMVAIARTFYVNGKGRMKEHPYLFPAYYQEGRRLSEKLKGLKIGW